MNDIICAKCGKHFSCVDTARSHVCKSGSLGGTVVNYHVVDSQNGTAEWCEFMESLLQSAKKMQKKHWWQLR